MTKLKTIISSSLIVATLATSLAVTEQAAAAPFGAGVSGVAKDAGTVTHVGWRHGPGWGWGPGALVGGIIGGALIAAAISEHRAAPRDMDRCARDFPDFSYRTGTYIDRRGVERVCPYLR
ncbi:MAG: hypothetical protein QM780_08165 [Hyphomicrobium sp.]|uniref:hypothetical protein n=1 Tax=Hyphomicrobium sp. TaxID=82 RepID=UPI0039E63BF7